MIGKTYLSTSLVCSTRNALSNGFPICFTIELFHGSGKEEIFVGRPGTASQPFRHSAKARRQRRVPERRVEPRLTCKLESRSNPEFHNAMTSNLSSNYVIINSLLNHVLLGPGLFLRRRRHLSCTTRCFQLGCRALRFKAHLRAHHIDRCSSCRSRRTGTSSFAAHLFLNTVT